MEFFRSLEGHHPLVKGDKDPSCGGDAGSFGLLMSRVKSPKHGISEQRVWCLIEEGNAKPEVFQAHRALVGGDDLLSRRSPPELMQYPGQRVEPNS
jgi:hypothetical protein